jgi:AcrR family transcriptional regulator
MEEIELKDKILKGAEELFMRFGVRSISMDDIARHLSVSKKTLYQHYADKEELVTMVSKSHLDRDMVEYEAVRTHSKNPIEELAMISVCMKKDMEKLNPSLLYDLQKFHPKAWSVWTTFRDKYLYQSIVNTIQRGIAEGYIRAEVNAEILATIRIQLVQIGFNPEIFQHEKHKLTEVQEQIFDHFVFGLVTDKGRKLYLKYKELNQQSSTIL